MVRRYDARLFGAATGEAWAKDYLDNRRWAHAADVYAEMLANFADSERALLWMERQAKCREELKLEALFREAITLHRRGQLTSSMPLFEQILAARPEGYELNGARIQHYPLTADDVERVRALGGAAAGPAYCITDPYASQVRSDG